MRHSSLEVQSGAKLLSASLRAIRRRREMTVAQVAQAMDLPQRTYESFEAGQGPMTTERIIAFADATDSDPYALMLGAMMGLPEFALDCANNKFALLFVSLLEEFARDQGGDIAFLDPRNLIGAFERLFNDLGHVLSDQESFFDNWFHKRTGSISLERLRNRLSTRRDKGD
jgi:transcriptional regulator with XRE-family HTH domain